MDGHLSQQEAMDMYVCSLRLAEHPMRGCV